MELVEMTNPIGNEDNMAKVRAMMNQNDTADEANLGDKATNGIPIDFTSEQSGKRYQGTVVFKRPNMTEFMRMGAIKSEILRQAGVQDIAFVDAGVRYMAQLLATLQVVAVKRPEWLLVPAQIEDTDLLYHVYDKYQDWESSFRPKPATPQASDSQGTE